MKVNQSWTSVQAINRWNAQKTSSQSSENHPKDKAIQDLKTSTRSSLKTNPSQSSKTMKRLSESAPTHWNPTQTDWKTQGFMLLIQTNSSLSAGRFTKKVEIFHNVQVKMMICLLILQTKILWLPKALKCLRWLKSKRQMVRKRSYRNMRQTKASRD